MSHSVLKKNVIGKTQNEYISGLCVLNITYAAIAFCADITSDSIYPTQQKQKYTQTEIKAIWKDTYQLEIFNILTNEQFIWLKTPELNCFLLFEESNMQSPRIVGC